MRIKLKSAELIRSVLRSDVDLTDITYLYAARRIKGYQPSEWYLQYPDGRQFVGAEHVDQQAMAAYWPTVNACLTWEVPAASLDCKP
jgi:hypothetical protein